MKVSCYTIGCKANQMESSAVLDEFKENGWEVVDFESVSDVYIINTCSVTSKSDSTSRYIIRKAIKQNPKAKIIVTGCYAQVAASEIEQIEGVSLILGNEEKNSLYNLVVQNMNDINSKSIVGDIMQRTAFSDKKVISASGRTRVSIKVQDGCNFRCSYCIVPYARGKSRSNNINNIINQVAELSRTFPEIVLTAIHLGQYGFDLTPKTSLEYLLKEIEKIETLKRLRLSSLDPLEITEGLIDTIAKSKKICNHFHISLQSGDDEILKSMKRRYTVEYYSKVIDMIVEKIPDVSIGSDIIVGFPGETEQNFTNTVNNLKNMPLSYLHVFSYSRRKGTPAANMNHQINPSVKKERNKILTELSKSINYNFRLRYLNRILEVVPEYESLKEETHLKGMTSNYISVEFKGSSSFKGTITPVMITAVTPSDTFGEIVLPM